MRAELVFSSNGRARGLYTELIDLHRLGSFRCVRASMIEFDEASQHWQVLTPDGSRVLFSDASRSVCLAWEQENLKV